MNRGITRDQFELIHLVRKSNPKMTQKQIGDVCGGLSDALVGKVLKATTWEEWEEYKKDHREKYHNTSKKEKGEVKQEQRTIIVSFDQMKALAKDVDNIKGNMELMVQIMLQLLDVWKEG